MRMTAVLAALLLMAAVGLVVCQTTRGGAAQSTATPTISPTATPVFSPTATPTVPASPTLNCGPSIEFTEEHTLALEILSGQGNDLLVDENRFQALAAEINNVLARVRAAAPVVAHIRVFEDYVPGYLVLGLEGPLAEAVLAAFGGQQAVSSLETGNAAFDGLTKQLCLIEARFEFSSTVHVFSLLLSDRLDVSDAAAAYLQIEGVAYASPASTVGDGPDIALQKQGDQSYVVFRDAYGDCPAGCIGQTLYCFIVSNTEVKQVEEPTARSFPSFVELTGTWGRPDQAQCQPLPGTPIEQPELLPPTGGRP